MKYQRRAALISLTIHGIFIGAVTGIAAFSIPAPRALAIDFSIEKSPSISPALPAPEPEPTPRQSRRPAPLPVKEEEAFPDTATQNSATDIAQFVEAESSGIDCQPIQVASIGPAGIARDTGKIREQERQRYLKEQFEYIRNIIYRKATYPLLALEMNITGTVMLSFCVREDGGVENVGILKGSGASILDRDAVATVKRAAPFPRPPARVTVKFPMEYRLE
jgi:protein TonB